MKIYLRIINMNLKTVFSLKKILSMFLILTFVFIIGADRYKGMGTVSEYIKYSLYGPSNLFDNVMLLFTWSLYQFYLIYVVGEFLYSQFAQENVYTILRIGNKLVWYICIQATCFIICALYFGLSMVIGCGMGLILNSVIDIVSLGEIFSCMILLILYSYYIITIYMCGIIKNKNHNYIFLILITILYLSITIGAVFDIDKFIPFNLGILSKHFYNGLSFTWSYIYLAIITSVNIVICKGIIKNNGFFEVVHN